MMERQSKEKVSLSDTSVHRIQTGHRPSATPTRDETAGLTLGGAVGILVVWAIESKGLTVPGIAAAAIGTVTAQVLHYLVSFLPRRRD